MAHKRFSGQENYIVLFSCGTKAGNPTWLGYQNMISFLLPTSGTSHKINHVYEEMLQEQLGINVIYKEITYVIDRYNVITNLLLKV